MFEKELYNEISENFSVENFNISVGFGDVPENTKAPYIVIYPLSNDGTRHVICNDDNYTDGRTSIQFSVYDTDYSNACYIGRQLDIFLSELGYLPNYNIILNNTEVIRGFPNVNTGLSIETVTRLFTYTKIPSKYMLYVNTSDLLAVGKGLNQKVLTVNKFN